MRISRTMAALALSAMVVGCGDSDSDSTTVPSTSIDVSTTPSSSVVATSMPDDELEALLLDVGDVGTGWKVGSPINLMDLTMSAELCADVVLDRELAQRLNGDVGIQFEPADGSYRHLMEQLNVEEPGRLSLDLQAFFDAAAECVAAAPTTPGTSVPTMEVFALPALGDQRQGFAYMALESTEAPVWFVRMAIVRVGQIAVMLGLTEILDTPDQTPTTSDAEFVALVERAVDRVLGVS